MFIIKYRQNPIKYQNPDHSKIERGKRMISKSLHNVNYKITCLRHHKRNHLNVDKNFRRVIRGLSLLYGFKPRSFVHDNFATKHHYTYLVNNPHILTISRWLKLLDRLTNQLDNVYNAKNLQDIQAIYHGYVYISGIQASKHYQLADHARKRLAKLGNGQRYRFVGKFARFGRKSNGQLSLLIKHIMYRGKEVTDHLWFSYTQGFKKLGHLNPKQRISFVARVKRYHKGYVPMDFVKHYDYKLSYPSRITKV